MFNKQVCQQLHPPLNLESEPNNAMSSTCILAYIHLTAHAHSKLQQSLATRGLLYTILPVGNCTTVSRAVTGIFQADHYISPTTRR